MTMNNVALNLSFGTSTENKILDDGKNMTPPLPHSYSPGPFDVICARGKHAKNHSGNLRFRQMIDKLSKSYGAVENRSQKTRVVNQIIDSIRHANGAFVKFENGQWNQIGTAFAREKIGQSLRENNHGIYRSSTKSKRKMRKEMNQRTIENISTVMSNNRSVAAGLSQLSLSLEKHDSKQLVKEQQDGVSSDESDSELEIAMTRANSQILASLKKDRSIQNLLHDESSS
jgi:hypothetical protein